MFQRLPRELQDEILSYCSRQDTASLRSAHSSWYDATSEALFSEVSVVCFAWSLENLCELSRSRLAERVKVLTIYSSLLGDLATMDNAAFEDRMQPIIYPACDICPPHGRVYYMPPEKWPQAYKTYVTYKKSHDEFLCKMRMLQRALERLSLRALTVRHFPEDRPDPRTWHRRKVVEWSGESFELAQEMTMIITYRQQSPGDVMPSLQRLPSTLRKLAIQQECHSQWRIELPEQLEELHLEVLYGDIAPLETTLALLNCPMLKKLWLIHTPGYRRGSLLEEHAHFDDVLALPQLEDVCLSIAVSNKALLSFRGRLELRNCYIDDVPAFLRARVNDLEFSRLYQWDPAARHADAMPYLEGFAEWQAGSPLVVEDMRWADHGENLDVPLDVEWDEGCGWCRTRDVGVGIEV